MYTRTDILSAECFQHSGGMYVKDITTKDIIFTGNNGKGSQTENTFLTGAISNPIKIRRWAGITGCAAAPKKRNEKNFDNTLQNHQDKSVYCSY